ncbi:Uncharacterized protein APZ42_000509 [Daphnia magna]|uniref:Uncharacterized protein n=1 Tax=Daphnia magna TaxID=35525 RepID=A0A164JL18_9CRUS|nr:Uncharacterized protein APZ42_000509 [Daphnia magna]
MRLHPGFLPTTCVSTVAMFIVDSKSTVIKLTVQELQTHLLGKEFSEKTTNVLRGNVELSNDKKFLNKSKSKPTSRKNFECFICGNLVYGRFGKFDVCRIGFCRIG